MPFDDLQKILKDILEKYPEISTRNHLNQLPSVYSNIHHVLRKLSSNNFGDASYALASVLLWLKCEHKDFFDEIKRNIFIDLSDHDRDKLLTDLYIQELLDIDMASLTTKTLAQIKDVNQVGSGNVLVDLIYNNYKWDTKKAFIDPEVAMKIVDVLPIMFQKLDEYRLKFPDDIYEYISPFQPKLSTLAGYVDEQKNRVLQMIGMLMQNEQIAITVVERAVSEILAPRRSNVWQNIACKCYTNEEKNVAASEEFDALYMQLPESFDSDTPEIISDRLKTILTLARDVHHQYSKAYDHFAFVLQVMLSSMNRDHQYFSGATKLTDEIDNDKIRKLLIQNLMLPKDAAGDKKFKEFLDGLAVRKLRPFKPG